MDLYQILIWFGGLGLFFIGTRYLTLSLQTLLGRFHVKMLSWLSPNIFWSWWVGVVLSLTSMLPSALYISTVGYLRSGLMSLSQSFAIILGIQFGSVAFLWMLYFLVGVNGFGILGIGFLLLIIIRSEKVTSLGSLFCGLGIILIGLDFMKDHFHAVSIMINSFGLEAFFAEPSLVAFLLSLLCGIVISYLSLFTHLPMGLAFCGALLGVFSKSIVFGLLCGEFLSTIGPTLLALKKGGRGARQVSFFSISVSLVSVLICGIFFQATSSGVTPKVLEAVTFYTLLALAPSILFLFFIPQVEKIFIRFFENSKKEPQKLEYLSSLQGMVSSLSAENVTQEIKKMTAMVHTILDLTLSLFFSQEKPETRKQILKYEKITDNIWKEIRLYITNLVLHRLSRDVARDVITNLKLADNLESIADFCEKILEVQKQFQPETLDKEIIKSMKGSFGYICMTYEQVFREIVEGEELPKHEFIAMVKEAQAQIKSIRTLLEGSKSQGDCDQLVFYLQSIMEKVQNLKEIQLGEKVG